MAIKEFPACRADPKHLLGNLVPNLIDLGPLEHIAKGLGDLFGHARHALLMVLAREQRNQVIREKIAELRAVAEIEILDP